MTEVNDELIINCYNNYISDDEQLLSEENITGKVKLSDKMGYLSSVDEARKNLENMFKGHKES
jgi:hypothetical protein